jgi:hypothetical protein
VHTFCRGHEGLEPILETEKFGDALSLADERVERAK